MLTINDRDVHIPKDADGFRDRHHKRPAQIGLHQLHKAKPLVVARKVAILAFPLSERLGLVLQECRGVSLFDEAQKAQSERRGNKNDPVRPPPAQVLRDEAADDRAKYCPNCQLGDSATFLYKY